MVVLLELEPHPACSRANPKSTAMNAPSSTRRLREMPVPIRPTPRIGNQIAYADPPGRNNDAGVVTRAVVVICRLRLWAPPLMFGMGLLVNEQAAPEGRPDPQARETDSGKPAPVGVTFAA